LIRSKVTVTFCGHEVTTVVISYTEAHENVTLSTVDEKREYESRTGKCSERAHTDTYTTVLDVEDLSRKTTREDAKGSLWYGVRTVNVSLDSFFLSWSALDKNGQRTMSTIIPTQSIEKVNVHYKKTRIQKSKLQPEGRNIYDLDVTTAEKLR
jgi:hypothetical protein